MNESFQTVVEKEKKDLKQISATEFVEENLKTIFAYALSRVSNKSDAEDLTNDIVLAILQSADKIKNPNAFYGYVWGIAANTYRKFMRRKSYYSFEEIDENMSDGLDFTSKILIQEDISRLRREIALLSKEYRDCTIAYYFDELSCAEISNKFNISLEMVKYYLFKTRKILKEGISMEREFGEKSFKPDPFKFNTIFSGNYNQEYRDLFTRKLPGQILLSAYWTPMTIRELAVELGVASVYLEDEIAMLQKYNFVTKTSAGKYQTNLVIFTDDFVNEFHKKAEKFTGSGLVEIVTSVKGKLEQIRQLDVACKILPDDRLLWSLLWPIMLQGHNKMEKEYPEFQEREALYDDTTGVNYGSSNDETDGEFGYSSCAGYARIDENFYASAVDFNVLPEKNRYFQSVDCTAFKEKIYKTISGKMEPEFMILTEMKEKKLFEILSEEISMMAELYNQLFFCACQIMHIHAPKSVGGQIDRIVFQTLFFRTVGLIGGCAIKSGAFTLPDFDGPAAFYVRENTKEKEESMNQNVLYV